MWVSTRTGKCCEQLGLGVHAVPPSACHCTAESAVPHALEQDEVPGMINAARLAIFL